MPHTKSRPQLGDSWVVEGEEDEDYLPDDEEYNPQAKLIPQPARKTGSRTSRTASTKSPEPELIMPTITIDSLDESQSDALRKSRQSRAMKDSRRRSTRSSRDKSPPSTKKTTASTKASISDESNHHPDMLKTITGHTSMVLSWVFEILWGALKLLKQPLSYMVAVWLLVGMVIMARNLLTTSIYASLSPICRVPGSGLLKLPFCPNYAANTDGSESSAVEFDQLMNVQAKFEEVLEESAGSVSLPLDMKRGEASIRDLRQLVRYSQLHSKNELVLEFDGFIETARIASYDLQRFNSHVGRAVDSVISTTRWTTRVLDGIQERDASRGAISAFINDRVLAAFQPVQFTEALLLDQYIQHTHLVEEEINKLILEAQAVLQVLNNIEDRLEIIHGIATRDDMHARTLRSETLSELWSLVGGNRSKITKMDRQLHLLKQVGAYRKTAFAHVSNTVLRLQAIAAGLEDLRERVASPELLRDRQKEVPLSVHIDNIQRGVERLEEVRTTARRAEDEQIRRTLQRGQQEDNLIEAREL